MEPKTVTGQRKPHNRQKSQEEKKKDFWQELTPGLAVKRQPPPVAHYRSKQLQLVPHEMPPLASRGSNAIVLPCTAPAGHCHLPAHL